MNRVPMASLMVALLCPAALAFGVWWLSTATRNREMAWALLAIALFFYIIRDVSTDLRLRELEETVERLKERTGPPS